SYDCGSSYDRGAPHPRAQGVRGAALAAYLPLAMECTPVPRLPGMTTDSAHDVTLITGGSTGIGAAAARRLLARGGRVAVTGRDGAKLDRLAAELDAGDA